ncbi:hypothetical protein ACXVUM_11620 [Williamsia sp. SKLECPSW1]
MTVPDTGSTFSVWIVEIAGGDESAVFGAFISKSRADAEAVALMTTTYAHEWSRVGVATPIPDRAGFATDQHWIEAVLAHWQRLDSDVMITVDEWLVS